MTDFEWGFVRLDAGIQELRQIRHRLMNRRKHCGVSTAIIDLQLQVVRSALHALYVRQRRLKMQVDSVDPGRHEQKQHGQ